MARLTKKSFRRKRILLGLCMFLSIAMISTGFAAWVISTDANQENNGNVNVGTITDANMQFELTIPEPLEINFQPKENDDEGRVTAQSDDKFESLSFTIAGFVVNADYLKTVTIEYTVPKTVIDAEAANYIKLKTVFDSQKTNDDGSVTYKANVSFVYDEDTRKAKLDDFVVEYEWGTVFGGMNPGTYYDDDAVGQEITDEVMTNTLADFYKLLYGATDAMTETADGTAPKFTVKLKATAN